MHCRAPCVFAGTQLRLPSQHIRPDVRQMLTVVQPTSVEVGPGALRTVSVSRSLRRVPVRSDRGRREIELGHLRDILGRRFLHQLLGKQNAFALFENQTGRCTGCSRTRRRSANKRRAPTGTAVVFGAVKYYYGDINRIKSRSIKARFIET